MQTNAQELPVALAVAAIGVTWVAAVALAATAGVIAASPAPTVPALTVAGVVLPMLVYRRSASVRRWFQHIGLRRLTLFHAWRIGPAVLFFHYGALGLLPPRFVADAGWGDLIAGVLAVAVVALPLARWCYWGVHLFGAADLIIAMATAMYFSQVDPASMAQVRVLPLALIPLFGVSVTFVMHLIAFDLLRRDAGETGTAVSR